MELMREHIEQYFRIRVGIEMPLILHKDFFLKRFCVSEIAVVRQSDPVGGVHIEGLGFSGTRATSGWVANMRNAHAASQLEHVTGVKNITHQTAVFPEMKTISFAGDDACCILATVL